jgi:hypothetical protein
MTPWHCLPTIRGDRWAKHENVALGSANQQRNRMRHKVANAGSVGGALGILAAAGMGIEWSVSGGDSALTVDCRSYIRMLVAAGLLLRLTHGVYGVLRRPIAILAGRWKRVVPGDVPCSIGQPHPGSEQKRKPARA